MARPQQPAGSTANLPETDEGSEVKDEGRDEKYASLDMTRLALERAGYSRVREGAANGLIGANRVETWLARSGQVYLAWNTQTGDWFYMEYLVAKDDGGHQGLADHLKRKAG